MKYFWGYLFLFLAFVFLMLGIFQPDMLLSGLGVLGHVAIMLAYILAAGKRGCVVRRQRAGGLVVV